MPKLTVREFFKRFPNDETCLEHVMSVRYGLRHDCQKCGTVDATFHRLAKRPAYSCASCGAHVYPCAGTVFQDTRTPLTVWFYVIFLFVTTRHGVSAKEIQRQIGVTYKTAWRMGHQIRTLLANVDEWTALRGHVELDETLVGGKAPKATQMANKTIVMGLKERGGPMRTEIIPDAKGETLRKVVLENVQPKTVVSTDEWRGYRLLTGDDYQHGTVNHSADEYARTDPETGIVHHVNHVESFWGMFKRSVRSTHISISRKHMQKYLDEFTFRANHREMQNAMFDLIIGAV